MIKSKSANKASAPEPAKAPAAEPTIPPATAPQGPNATPAVVKHLFTSNPATEISVKVSPSHLKVQD